MRIFGYILIIVCCLFIFSCGSDDAAIAMMEPVVEKETTFGSFEVDESNDATLSGSIDENTAADLTELLVQYPNIDRIVMEDVNGATSAEAAFSAARVVRSNMLDIHITDNSTIRKEAVDFLLGGIKRSKGIDVKIGQSAWINAQGQEATDFDFGDDAHLPWINFYVEMEYQFQLATDYYNFYIYAADADDIYFFTDDQINTFNLIN